MTKLNLGVAQYDKNRKFYAPKYGSRSAGGLDFFAPSRIEITQGSQVCVATNVALEIPNGFCGVFAPRSGLGTKHSVRFSNTSPIIDSDYRGEVFLFLELDFTRPSRHETCGQPPKVLEIAEGERFCQMLLLAAPQADVIIKDYEELTTTERGTGGFGSSGRF